MKLECQSCHCQDAYVLLLLLRNCVFGLLRPERAWREHTISFHVARGLFRFCALSCGPQPISLWLANLCKMPDWLMQAGNNKQEASNGHLTHGHVIISDKKKYFCRAPIFTAKKILGMLPVPQAVTTHRSPTIRLAYLVWSTNQIQGKKQLGD